MKTTNPKLLALMVSATLVLTACGGVRQEHPEITRLNSKLQRLQSDPRIAPYAAEDLRLARSSLQMTSAMDRQEGVEFKHRLYIAERYIDIAEFQGRAGHAEKQIGELDIERERLVAQARTMEAQMARGEAMESRQIANSAQRSASEAKMSAQMSAEEAAAAREASARSQADLGNAQNQLDSTQAMLQTREMELSSSNSSLASTQEQLVETSNLLGGAEERADQAEKRAQQLQVELADLKGQQTERGVMVTLGDVLFEVDRAELKTGAERKLSTLINALSSDVDRTVIIEGHTDTTGSAKYNQDLSLRRAQEVKRFLTAQGIAAQRIEARGMSFDFPVADNGSATGRQQNRRVEVVIVDAQRPAVQR